MKRLAALLFTALLACAGQAAAQEFPSRPVHVVVPFPPGGALDLLARKLGEKMQGAMGQPIVIENKPGAGTLIGTDYVARSAPDGYTLILTSSGGITQAPALYSKLSYDPSKLTPITQVAIVPVVLIVRADTPVNSVKELAEYLRARPGKTNYASFGNGSTMHIYGETFKRATGTDTVHVPYKGDAPSMAALLGGEVQYLFTNPVSASGFAKQGKVKMLAVTGGERLPALPNVPTMSEAGMKGFEAEGWYAYFGPANIPPVVAEKLHKTISAIVKSPDINEFLQAQGTKPTGVGLREFGATLPGEQAIWGKLIRQNGIKLD